MTDAEDLRKANALMDKVRNKVGDIKPTHQMCDECSLTYGGCFWQIVLQTGSVASALTLYRQSQGARETMLGRCSNTELTAVIGVELGNADSQ